LHDPASQQGSLIVYDNELRVPKEDIKVLKDILDKLKIHHTMDDICFHATDAIIGLIKYCKNTDVWKVEKNGGVNLKNRFGHSGQFEYRTLCIPSLIEFLLVDLNVLNDKESDFLDIMIKKAANISLVQNLP
jgi:hypothetical protein